jgi:putative ABC transport system substrate-binding protein
MRRRDFLGVVAWPVAARAQQRNVRRIGVLMGAAPSVLGEIYLASFSKRLEQLNWVNGRNVQMDVRWWTGGPEQMRPVVAEMLAASPDVVMVFSNLALSVIKPIAGNVPLVFVGVGDPVGDGFVASLARPGGNVTGFAGTEAPMAGKWLEVLKETAPSLTRAMAIVHLETPAHQAMWNAIRDAAPRSGIEVTAVGVHDAAEIESAMASFAAKADGGVIVLPHAVTWANGDLIIALAARHRLPTIYATEGSVAAGGLVSYGLDFVHSFWQTAEYVDRVLRGTKPADLPVQQPSKFKLTFNLKAAKAIGISVAPTLLNRADEVIE